MCGIGGFITTKKHSRFAQEKFAKILLAGEVRGTDACGIAFNTGKNKFYYMKAPKPASEFIKETIYKDLMEAYDPTILIGHNRAKTQGDAKDNKNNHPIITKTGLSLIHNGIISNDAEIVKDFNLTLDGEVDSEVIVRLIEYYIYVKKFDTIKAIKLTAQKLKGGLAFALLNAKEPETAYLLASDNPLSLAYHKPTATIFWASTDEILKRGLIEFDYYFQGFFKKARSKDDYIFEELDDDMGLKITTRGWTMFSVKRPENVYSGYSGRGDYGGGCGYSDNRTEDTSTAIEVRVKSQTPFIVEAKDEGEIKKLLKEQVVIFDEFEVVTKPSEYLSELLLLRLEVIQDTIMSEPDYPKYFEPIEIQNEVRRIIDTLIQRQKSTKREIYIPTPDEVMAYGNRDETDFKKVDWVLAEMNKPLFNSLTDAQEEQAEDEKLDALATETKQTQLLD